SPPPSRLRSLPRSSASCATPSCAPPSPATRARPPAGTISRNACAAWKRCTTSSCGKAAARDGRRPEGPMPLKRLARHAREAFEVPRDLLLGRYPDFVTGGALPKGQVPVFVFHSLEPESFGRKL